MEILFGSILIIWLVIVGFGFLLDLDENSYKNWIQDYLRRSTDGDGRAYAKSMLKKNCWSNLETKEFKKFFIKNL